jgi:hypothetical protein
LCDGGNRRVIWRRRRKRTTESGPLAALTGFKVNDRERALTCSTYLGT